MFHKYIIKDYFQHFNCKYYFILRVKIDSQFIQVLTDVIDVYKQY